MKGTILTSNILRAEDGNRYSFDYNDFENLDTSTEIVGAEVDFEPENNKAKSIIITKLSLKTKQVIKKNTNDDFYDDKNLFQKIDDALVGSESFELFYGNVNIIADTTLETDRTINTTTTKSLFSDDKYHTTTTVNSTYISVREFKMGNEYFNFKQSHNEKGLIGDKDEVFVICRGTISRHHDVWTLVNYTRNTILNSKSLNIGTGLISTVIISVLCFCFFLSGLSRLFDDWTMIFLLLGSFLIGYYKIKNFKSRDKKAKDYKKALEFAKNYKK